MIVTGMYKQLELNLNNTRRHLWQVCEDLGLDPKLVELTKLDLDQCTHCGIWLRPRKLVQDLDNNPICGYCKDLIGL